MVVAGDDIIGFDLQGAGQKFVVGGIGFDFVGLVKVCRDDKGFFSYQAYDRCLFALFKKKSFADVGLSRVFSISLKICSETASSKAPATHSCWSW